MKLRVVELLLISTLPAMVMAEQGLPSWSLTLATLVGGTLAAGSANAFNMIIEAESDRMMSRTNKRPLVTRELTSLQASIFAWVIGLLSLAIFAYFTNILATVLAAIAILYYVIVYTIGLKRNTEQNIVWGGAAGCMPALIGWAAVTNSLSISAWLWFFVIFFWTPPHFWALAIKYKDDYAAAKIPMLPVAAPRNRVRRWMLIHSWAMVASSLLLIAQANLGLITGLITLVIGGYFLLEIYRLKDSGDDYEKVAARIFHGSITYLSLLSVVLVAAQLLSA